MCVRLLTKVFAVIGFHAILTSSYSCIPHTRLAVNPDRCCSRGHNFSPQFNEVSRRIRTARDSGRFGKAARCAAAGLDVALENIGRDRIEEVVRLRSMVFGFPNERAEYLVALNRLSHGNTCIVATVDVQELEKRGIQLVGETENLQKLLDLKELLVVGWISHEEFERRAAKLRETMLSRSRSRAIVGAVDTSRQEFETPDDAKLYISGMAVLEPLRGQGIGRLLLEAAERDAAAQAVTDLYLHAENDNPVAVALYRSAGYRELPGLSGPGGSGLLSIPVGPTGDPQDVVLLHKRLPTPPPSPGAASASAASAA